MTIPSTPPHLTYSHHVIETPMTDLQTAQVHWATALGHLQAQMTRATFDFCLRGNQVVAVQNNVYQIGVVNPAALDWLNNHESVRVTINRELSNVTGAQFSIEFVPLASTLPPPEGVELPEAQPTGPSEAGRALASINYYSAYFESKGTGFNQIPHPYIYFWQFLLGPGFDLLLLLLADETSPLTKNPATWWSQPRSYSFDNLTQRLNKSHPRYVAGDEAECTRSRDWRKEGKPLLRPEDCCGGPRYEHLRFKKHPKPGCGLICNHWGMGRLEILDRWQLVKIELNEGYKCRIQTWRMLPYPTPSQISLLHPTIQQQWEDLLRKHGPRLDPPLYFPFWQTATEENIVPLLATHDLPEVSHNFDQRRNYQDFLRHAVLNPHYAANGDETEEEDDETL